jgi:hypothetical protein
MTKRNTSTIMVACALSALSFTATVQASCAGGDVLESDAGKYLKVYVQEPDNIGSSWRLYVRPRNKACLTLTGNGFQSPASTPGQTDGTGKSGSISPGSKNCDDDYKSRMSVDIPSGQAIYNTYTALKTDGTMSKQKTMVGFNVDTTKNGGYAGVVYVIPMTKADGTYDNANSKVLGMCFK